MSSSFYRDELQLLPNATVQQLRLATSRYLGWDRMVSKPNSVYFDQQQWLLCQPCWTTHGIECSLFASGIAARIGENVHPSLALLDLHICSLKADLEEQYLSARTPPVGPLFLVGWQLFYCGLDGYGNWKHLICVGKTSMLLSLKMATPSICPGDVVLLVSGWVLSRLIGIAGEERALFSLLFWPRSTRD
jgi:hypothetical protein